MSGSNEGRDASQAPTPSNADTQIEPHRPLGSHYQQMLSLLQVAMHRTIFHTEHEDYPFWATALTYAVEKYMHRTAAVVPQSKIWARPQVNRKSAKRGKGAIPASSVPADSAKKDDAPVARTGEVLTQRSETGASRSCSTVQDSKRVENNEHPTPSNSQQAAPSLPIGPVTALIDFDPDAE